MKKAGHSPVSIRDVAAAAGISKSAASYALRHDPSISKATRDRVWRIAERLGYSRDARLGQWMTKVRNSSTKGLLPIAWLNTDTIPSFRDTKFLSPYLEGAEQRCLELGYRLDEIWMRQPGLTQGRISRILRHRGIEGIVIGYTLRHMRLNFDRLAAVSLEGGLLAPRLHRVTSNVTFNLTLAIKSLWRLGYRRIGVCLTEQVDRFSHHLVRSTLHHWASTLSVNERVEPLFHPISLRDDAKAPQVAAWVRKEKPEVIVCHDNRMLQWLQEMGYQIPRQMGVVHLALDDDVLDWAGVYSNRRIIGRTAVEMVISLLQNRQLGVPTVPGEMLIPGTWRKGRTLLSKKETSPRGRKS